MFELIFQALIPGLKIWEHKEARKYLDKALKLQKEYYEESNQTRQDHAVLDNIEFELGLLIRAYSSEVERSPVKIRPE